MFSLRNKKNYFSIMHSIVGINAIAEIKTQICAAKLMNGVTCFVPRIYAWVKSFRIIPEFRILRLTFYRKSASKC